jgi:hypothetical protein
LKKLSRGRNEHGATSTAHVLYIVSIQNIITTKGFQGLVFKVWKVKKKIIENRRKNSSAKE